MYNNAPIRNNTLLQEAYNAGYYRAMNEQDKMGGGGDAGAAAAVPNDVQDTTASGQDVTYRINKGNGSFDVWGGEGTLWPWHLNLPGGAAEVLQWLRDH